MDMHILVEFVPKKQCRNNDGQGKGRSHSSN